MYIREATYILTSYISLESRDNSLGLLECSVIANTWRINIYMAVYTE